MRKLIVHEFITLDGVIQAPGGEDEDRDGGFAHGGWTRPYWHDEIGMSFGAHTNAHTSFDQTVFKIELPRTGEEMTGEGLKLFRDFFDGMLLENATNTFDVGDVWLNDQIGWAPLGPAIVTRMREPVRYTCPS